VRQVSDHTAGVMNRWARLVSRANRLIGLVLDVLGAMRTEVHTRRPFGADEEDVAGWRVLAQMLDRSGVRRDVRLLARRDQLAGAAP
jgi:hypothetical protein